MTQQAQKIVNRLVPLLRAAVCSDNEPERDKENPNFTFTFAELGGLELSHEEAKKFREAVAILSQAYPKVGRTTCEHELQRFCCEFVPTFDIKRDDLPFGQRLPALLELLEKLQEASNTLFVEVSGLNLKIPEWVFGPVVFMHGDHPDVENQRLTIQPLDGTQIPSIEPDIIVAKTSTVGAIEYAAEDAAERVQQVLDAIQFLSIQENPAALDATCLGFGLYRSSPVPLLSNKIWGLNTTEPSWHQTGAGDVPFLPSGHPKLCCALDEQTRTRFSTRGGDEISSMIAQGCPSAFDLGAMAAVSWIAYAIRERDFSRKYLGFYIALEAIFARDTFSAKDSQGYQRPIMPIEDGVAFLLASTTGGRKRIAKDIVELRRSRNRIVHQGYNRVDRGDLIRLAHYSWNCCAQAVMKRDLFRKEDSFRDWLLDRKFGGA